MASKLPVSINAAALQPLSKLSIEAWDDGSALVPLLSLWRETRAAEGAALYQHGATGGWVRQVIVGSGSLPARLESGSEAEQSGLVLPGRVLLVADPPISDATTDGSDLCFTLELLLASCARLCRLTGQLKEQSFQENYKVVKLEALYDVGLAIGSMLDLEELYEEILLRAVSLLDARRGALYLIDPASAGRGAYRLNRTIGGTARETLALEDSQVNRLLGGEGGAGQDVLPGATHVSAAAITVERNAHGLIVVADKESRHGVGPFLGEDRRALSMFAAQAAIALENAALHLQALEKQRLERELELAAEIQRGILPASTPILRGMEILGWNRPTQQVGGDYYGFLTLGDGRLGVVVADVTGKGMPAALLVSTLHSALHLLLDRVSLGEELVSRLNEHIAESTSANKFITLIAAEVDETSGMIGFLNAGHNPGLLVRRNGSVGELSPSGLPLGLLKGSKYRFDRVLMEPGDLLCLYSDGITECAAPDDEEFGLERLVPFLAENREQPLPVILERLDAAVGEFSRGLPQGDDQTVVLLRRN